MDITGSQSGGVHFVGKSSTGKSTALYVGGSVLGGGAKDGFVQQWRSTANGLEATAGLHSDLALFLDEISQIDAGEAGEVAYLLANGSGKSRMSRNLGMSKKLRWSLMFLSSGECTLSEHAETAGKHVRAGVDVRLLNVDADAGAKMGLFEDLHEVESPAAFADQLRTSALRFYGSPLRPWLTFLTGKRSDIARGFRNFQNNFITKSVPAGASGEVFRAAQRFALVAFAGELATEQEITGWHAGEATEAAEKCFRSWLSLRGTIGAGDNKKAINQVRRFLESYGTSRFQSIRGSGDEGNDDPNESLAIRDRAGFYRHNPTTGEAEYLILQETFKAEVCAGIAYTQVREALEEGGYLVREVPHWTIKPRQNTRVYCIRAQILEATE